jgi:hypothetical protein
MVTSNATVAALTAVGLLLRSPACAAIALAGAPMLATPLLLPRKEHVAQPARAAAQSPA